MGGEQERLRRAGAEDDPEPFPGGMEAQPDGTVHFEESPEHAAWRNLPGQRTDLAVTRRLVGGMLDPQAYLELAQAQAIASDPEPFKAGVMTPCTVNGVPGEVMFMTDEVAAAYSRPRPAVKEDAAQHACEYDDCEVCSARECPHHDPHHRDKDGCPSCSTDEAEGCEVKP